MKNVYEVLRQKEMELTRLEKEVEALRVVAPLLSEEKEPVSEMPKAVLPTAVNGPQATTRMTDSGLGRDSCSAASARAARMGRIHGEALARKDCRWPIVVTIADR